MERPLTSQIVIDEFAKIVDAQDIKGFKKYGTTIDEARDKNYNWELMALEETADLQKYLVRRIMQQEEEIKQSVKREQDYLDGIEQLEGMLRQANQRINELESIKDVEVYWNSAVKINFQNGEEKLMGKVLYVDAFLSLDKKAPYEDIDD